MPLFRGSTFLCATLALAVVLVTTVFLALLVRQDYAGDWTALFLHGDRQTVPPTLPQPTYVWHNSAGYDGQFYRVMAHDPWLRHGSADYVDLAQFRYRRILLPALAWLLGGTSGHGIDTTYIGLVLFSLGLGVYLTARWLVTCSLSPLWSLGFVLLPATLVSLLRMTTDLTLCALFAGFAWSLRRKRFAEAMLWAAPLALTRETGLLAAAGAVVWSLSQRQWRRAAGFAAALSPTLAWYVYVAARAPRQDAGEQFGAPVYGVLLALRQWHGWPLAAFCEWLALAAYVGALITTTVWLIRRRPWSATEWGVALLVALFWTMAGADYLTESTGFARPISPVLLALWVWGIERRFWLAPALAVLAGAGQWTYYWVSVKHILGHT